MIVISINYFLPGIKAGGPPVSVANLVKLMEADFNYSETLIVTSDRDSRDSRPYSLEAKQKVLSNFISRVQYLSKWNYFDYIKLLLRSKTIIVNSVFHRKYGLLLPLLVSFFTNKKVFCFTRGELQRNSLKNKLLLKKLFLKFISVLVTDNIIFVYSNDFERSDSYLLNNNPSFRIVSNLPSEGQVGRNCFRKDRLSLVYLGRVAVDKNLLDLIISLSYVEIKTELTIFGPISDLEYWKKCQKRIENLPSHINVKYNGVLGKNDLASLSDNYHYLVCPSLSENFGHSISEALHMGMPVLCTAGTPWQNLEEYGLGYNVSFADSSLSELFTQDSLIEIARLERKDQVDKLDSYPIMNKIHEQNRYFINEIINS